MNRREVIKEYKKSVQPMGIVQVRNIRNNRVYLTASANTAGTINSIRFQLKMGTFLPSPGLAQEWKEQGEQSLVFEVRDELKPVDDPAYDYRDVNRRQFARPVEPGEGQGIPSVGLDTISALLRCHRWRDNITGDTLCGQVSIDFIAAGSCFIYEARLSARSTEFTDHFIQ